MTARAPSAAALTEIIRRLDAVAPLLPDLGRRLCEMQTADLDISSKSNARDLVTAADLESQKTLTDFIRRTFPGDNILAEEGDAGDWRATVEGAEFCWVIDPLDGTVNYSHGIPLFCVSVGLTFQGEPVGGMVLVPALGEFYRAVAGQGATLNDRPLRVSTVDRMAEAMVVTGFPYDRERHIDTLMKGIETLLHRAQGIRRTGTAALDLCWCAAGRFDAYYEFNLNPWDTCGGVVILREAGGRVSGFRGQDFDLCNPAIAASNGRFHDEFVEALARVPWEG